MKAFEEYFNSNLGQERVSSRTGIKYHKVQFPQGFRTLQDYGFPQLSKFMDVMLFIDSQQTDRKRIQVTL